MPTGPDSWRACCVDSTFRPQAGWPPWLPPTRSSRWEPPSIPTAGRSSASAIAPLSAPKCPRSSSSGELAAFLSAVGPGRDREKRHSVHGEVNPVGVDTFGGRGSDGVPAQLAEPVQREVGRYLLDDVRQQLLRK